jgi:hypothetical protein
VQDHHFDFLWLWHIVHRRWVQDHFNLLWLSGSLCSQWVSARPSFWSAWLSGSLCSQEVSARPLFWPALTLWLTLFIVCECKTIIFICLDSLAHSVYSMWVRGHYDLLWLFGLLCLQKVSARPSFWFGLTIAHSVHRRWVQVHYLDLLWLSRSLCPQNVSARPLFWFGLTLWLTLFIVCECKAIILICLDSLAHSIYSWWVQDPSFWFALTVAYSVHRMWVGDHHFDLLWLFGSLCSTVCECKPIILICFDSLAHSVHRMSVQDHYFDLLWLSGSFCS